MKKKGFTLVELMLFMAISSGFVLVLTTILTTSVDSQLETVTRSSIDQTMQLVSARIGYDMRKAASITTPATTGTTSSTLVLNNAGLLTTYQITSGRITITDSGGTSNLSDDGATISNFQATRVGTGGNNDSIRLSFTATSKSVKLTGNTVSRNFSSTFSPR